jgi:hypothetical protein
VGKSASAPDPYATAQAQGAVNESTARLQARMGNPDQYGPTGTVTHDFRPDDTVGVTTTLSPNQQDVFNKVQGGEQAAAGRMQALLGSGVDTSGLTGYEHMPASATWNIQSQLPQSGQIASGFDAGGPVRTDFSTGQALGRQGTQDYGQQRKEVEDAIMGRVQGQYDRDRASQDARLAAQGFNVNTQGYRNASDEMNRSLTDARMQAVLAGGQEQSRLFGLDQSRLGFNNAASQAETKQYNDALAAMNAGQQQGYNQAQTQGFNEWGQFVDRNNAVRNQQLAETLQLRSQPVNEVASLFGLGNQIAAPNAAPYQGSQIAAPNLMQAVQNKYAADSANATSTNNAVAGTAGTLAAAGMMAVAV